MSNLHKQLLTGSKLPSYRSLDNSGGDNTIKMGADSDTQGVTTDQKRATCGQVIKDNLLIILTLIGVVLGFGLGFGIRPLKPSEDAMLWIGLPGEIYMRMLTCTILPLVVSSIIAGTSTLDPKSNGKISTIALLYITLVNLFGVILGIIMYFILKPGEGAEISSVEAVEDTKTNLQTQDLFIDLIRNLFPDNIITACFQTTQTEYLPQTVMRSANITNATEILVRSKGTSSSMNILGIIVISSVIGIATAQVGETAQSFVHFFKASAEIIIRILRGIVWFTPIGVVSLITASVGAVEDLESTFESVGVFALSVCLCMALFLFIFFPVLFFLLTKTNPISFLVTCIRPWMTSLATASTAVAIPDMFYVCESKLNIDVRISRFVIPFSDALNRSGSCCFILLAAVFLCNLENVQLEASQFLVVAILTWVSGFAIPSVPSASIISVLIILSSVNVNTTNIGLLLALEWLLDRLRTSVNALSIICGAVLVNKLCKEDLDKLADKQSVTMETEVEIKVQQTSLRHETIDTNM